MRVIVENTSKDDQRIARDAMIALQKATRELEDNFSRNAEIEVQAVGASIMVPKKAFSLFMNILSSMSEGKSFTLTSEDSEVSIQQAADMLKVSQPHLTELLESGKIPFRQSKNRRRILLSEVVAYENRFREKGAQHLQWLTEQAQDLNLGYE